MTSNVDPDDPDALQQAAAGAMGRHDFHRAVALLERATALDPAPAVVWLGLAAARRASGTLELALQAVDEALRREPRSFAALLMRASLLERTAGVRAAAPVYGAALLQAPPEAMLDKPTLQAVTHAREVNACYGDELNAALEAGASTLSVSSVEAKRVRVFIDRLTGRRRAYRQEPLGYDYPGLPAVEVWDRIHFPWLPALEAAAPAIAAEMLAVGFRDPASVPYMDLPDTGPLDQWVGLNRSPDWSAFHLIQHGRPVQANCARCPATLAALARVPQPQAQNRSPSAMFSILAARTRIPPHTGVSNTRLVGHLALSVPQGCGLRVGAETVVWREGCGFVFDDTIEHEAWNDSDQPRAVLIFDVRHPLIPDEAHAAIAEVMAAMDAFIGVTGSGQAV